MKKLNICLLVVTSIGLLAACSTSKSDEKVIQPGSPVLTDALKEANVKVNKKYTGGRTWVYNDPNLPTGYTACESQYNLDYGLLYVEKGGKYGVFSLLANKLIIGARLNSYPSTTKSDSQFGFSMLYEDVDKYYYVADGAGNTLYKIAEKDYQKYYGWYYSISYSYDKDEGLSSELTITMMDNNYDYTYEYCTYKYDSNNKSTFISKRTGKDDAVTPIVDPGVIYEAKSTKLSSGYVINIGYNYFVYGNDGSLKKQILVPSDVSKSFLLGDKLVYQRYTNEGSKYTVYNKYIDLLSDDIEAKSFDLDAVISSVNVLKVDKDTYSKYAVLSLIEVTSSGDLGAKRVLVIDDQLEIHEELTDFNIFDMTKLSNGYYLDDTSGYRLFDPNGKLVFSTIGLYSSSFSYESELFQGTHKDGESFIVDNNGKLLTPVGKYYTNNLDNIRVADNILFLNSSNGEVYFNTQTQEEVKFERYTSSTKYVYESYYDYSPIITRLEYSINQGSYGDNTMTLKLVDGTVLKRVDRYLDDYSMQRYEFTQRLGENRLSIYYGYYYYKTSSTSYDSVRGYFILGNMGHLSASEIVAPSSN